MPGLKTNERPGTRASVKHVRGSATKARRVLDLVRNESVEDAVQILKYSETGVSEVILKLLNSAVANAGHNDGIPADELFISACYADEGPTLKRWRPRARGRATRIRKRTSHITMIVTRYEADALEERQARAASKGGTSAAQAEARRRRVSQSKGEDDAAETTDAVADAAAPAAAAVAGDDLTTITGIGPKFAEQLNAAGITTIAALAAVSDEQRAELAEEIKGDDIDSWVDQAKDLAASGSDSEEEE